MVTVSVLLLLLSASSPPVHSFLTFHYIPDLMNYTEAREACREEYFDLATLYSDKDNTELARMGSGWIRLSRGQFSEKWSNGDPVTFRYLTGDCGTLDCCAAMKADGSWESLWCRVRRYFMCYEQDASKQTPNYHLILESKTWYEAQSYCRWNYTDLVSIRDQQYNEEVRIKGLNSTMSFWIGLLRDDWQWTDGGNSAYRNWGSDYSLLSLYPYRNWWSIYRSSSPYDCVLLSRGIWYSYPCSYNRPALCYRNTSIHVSEVTLSWGKALDYCQKENRAGILTIDSQAEQEALESELMRRGVSPGSLWVGLGPNRISELNVSSSPLTCEDVERQTDDQQSHCPADTHTAGEAPDYVMDSSELHVVCKLK